MHNKTPGEKKEIFNIFLCGMMKHFPIQSLKIDNVFQLDYRVMYCGIFSVFKPFNSSRDFFKSFYAYIILKYLK